jgi:hypothetical protein
MARRRANDVDFYALWRIFCTFGVIIICIGLSALILSAPNNSTVLRKSLVGGNTIVVLLAHDLSATMSERHARLLKAGINAHIVLDVDAPVDRQYGQREHFISSRQLEGSGFTGLTVNSTAQWSQGHQISVWERAVFWCLHQLHHDNCWLIEDDVIWEDPSAIVGVISAYSGDNADFIAKYQGPQVVRPDWLYWNSCEGILPEPRSRWIGAFLPLCRVSRRLLKKVADVAANKGRLCCLEALFSSLVALDDSHSFHASYFNVDPPSELPRTCIRRQPLFSEKRGLMSRA